MNLDQLKAQLAQTEFSDITNNLILTDSERLLFRSLAEYISAIDQDLPERELKDQLVDELLDDSEVWFRDRLSRIIVMALQKVYAQERVIIDPPIKN